MQKSIINNIRYTADRGTKEAYQNVLGKDIFMHTVKVRAVAVSVGSTFLDFQKAYEGEI